MNIFVVDEDPTVSAQSLCDKHVNKMAVESVQMLVSALRRHGATDSDVPLTTKGTPHRGGYANHPSTVWAGETSENFTWLFDHAVSLCEEFDFRFNKEHACLKQLDKIVASVDFIPTGRLTDIALCVGDDFHERLGFKHAPLSQSIDIYREFYIIDKAEFAKWEKGRPAPAWWTGLTTNLEKGII
jgi:hypothetical protein